MKIKTMRTNYHWTYNRTLGASTQEAKRNACKHVPMALLWIDFGLLGEREIFLMGGIGFPRSPISIHKCTTGAKTE